MLPLEGYRVVNFGWQWSAPHLGALMADCGAEVIKVESNSRMDIFRRLSLLDPLAGNPFHVWNHGVLGITANLKEPRAVELIKRLVAESDVVVENYPPRVMAELGLDYERMREVRPDIVMLSLPAAGQYGPLKDVMTYGPSLGALTGLHSMLGYLDGEPAFEYCFTDPVASVTGVFLILAALRHRNRTGEGQFIDMAQAEATTCLLGEAVMEYGMNGRVMGFQENRSRWMAPHNNYPCRGEDEWVSIAVKTEEEWRGLCEATGNAPWARDERFIDCFSRLRHQEELDGLVSEWTLGHTKYEVAALLQGAGVAAAPVIGEEEQYWDPHHRARETYQQVDYPGGAIGVPVCNTPWCLSHTPLSIQRSAPMLGQHNDYVYGELLGLSADERARLAEENVLF